MEDKRGNGKWKEFANPVYGILKDLALTGWTSYVSISLGLLALLLATAFVAKNWVSRKAKDLTENIPLNEKQIECRIINDQAKQNFINDQRRDIIAYAKKHRRRATEFYGVFYATFAVFSVIGLLAAIVLALITKTEINNSIPHLVTIFLVSTAFVISYQGFFGIFQQKNDLEKNAKPYVSYGRLVNQIDTYRTTGKVNVKDPNLAFVEALPKNAVRVKSVGTPGISNKKSENNEMSEYRPGAVK